MSIGGDFREQSEEHQQKDLVLSVAFDVLVQSERCDRALEAAELSQEARAEAISRVKAEYERRHGEAAPDERLVFRCNDAIDALRRAFYAELKNARNIGRGRYLWVSEFVALCKEDREADTALLRVSIERAQRLREHVERKHGLIRAPFDPVYEELERKAREWKSEI
ncbi:MAG TPA: hypothetical protein V6D08_15620 [Candidatus Obscuribacterales bacterium]